MDKSPYYVLKNFAKHVIVHNILLVPKKFAVCKSLSSPPSDEARGLFDVLKITTNGYGWSKDAVVILLWKQTSLLRDRSYA